MITVSAPAKIHLLGEHAVVYGKPALLAAIDKRLYVTVKTSRGTGSRSAGQNHEKIIIKSTGKSKLVGWAIEVFQKAFTLTKLPPIEIEVTSQIPIGCGLGSSAALAAATIGALLKLVKNLWQPARINELAYEVEKTSHGNPSGADNTVVVFGGLVWFRREFDFLKSIWNLPIQSYKIPKFLLINSGRPKENTREMVALVSYLYKKKKKTVEEILNDQEVQTKRLLLAFRNDDRQELVNAIRHGERNLEKIGVVGNFAQKIIREIEKNGGVAKVCGAGGRITGSGMLLCYHDNLSKLFSISERYRVSASEVIFGGEGIRIENKPR